MKSIVLIFKGDPALAADDEVDRIVGGVNANINEFPYQVSLRTIADNHHFCGGSIISDRHILTAAHCVFGSIRPPYRNVRVYAGSSSSKSVNGSAHLVKRIDVHPKYTGRSESSMRNDVAVITVRGKSIISARSNLDIFTLPTNLIHEFRQMSSSKMD